MSMIVLVRVHNVTLTHAIVTYLPGLHDLAENSGVTMVVSKPAVSLALSLIADILHMQSEMQDSHMSIYALPSSMPSILCSYM